MKNGFCGTLYITRESSIDSVIHPWKVVVLDLLKQKKSWIITGVKYGLKAH